MNTPPNKRSYHSDMQFVEHGFRSCWQNSQDLVTAAKQLLDISLHAPALSLSVLALEELGKLFAIDGLLFARSDDYKTKMYSDATKKHITKLDLFACFPLFLDNLARTDPRHGRDPIYAMATVIDMQQLKVEGNSVLTRLSSDGFRDLDKYKQRGFYVSTTEGVIKPPRENVDPSLARLVYQLAWRVTTSIDFLLKGGNLERYILKAKAIRDELTEEQHLALEERGKEEAQRLFVEQEEQ